MGDVEAATSEPTLRVLRRLLPAKPIDLEELLDLIRELASELRRVSEVDTDRLPHTVVTDIPSIHAEYTTMPVAGYAYWDTDDKRWVIRINQDEAIEDRRFTLLHEFAHILWHNYESCLFSGLNHDNRRRLAEHAADLFAGEALIPTALLKRHYAAGLRDVEALAEHFAVTPDAIRWKFGHTDIPTTPDRTSEPSVHPRSIPLEQEAA